MKHGKIKLWTALMVCLALAVTVWPVAERIRYVEESARQVEEIEKRVAALEEEQLAKYRDLAKWYNHQLELEAEGLRGIYGQILNLGEGRMGVLEVPELRLRLPISHGYDGIVGHDPNSPLPIGGKGRQTVLILAQAQALQPGQVVYIDILGQRLVYRVESVQVMRSGWSLDRPSSGGQDLLTLVYDRWNTRTIIRCVRCADLTVRQLDVPEPGRIILAAALPLALLLPAFVWHRGYTKREHSLRMSGFCRKNPEKSNLF